VAVRDIAVHPKENDLIIGTHGRGIWILDDIQPLQKMNPQVFASDFHLFDIRPAYLYQIASSGEPSSRPAYSGKNPDYGMILTAYIKNKPKKKPVVVINNTDGEKIHEFTFPTRVGILRQVWNLQIIPKTKEGKVVKPTGMGLTALPVVYPGSYTVEMTTDEKTLTQAATINPDPRFPMGIEDYQAMVEAQVNVIAVSKKLSLGVTATNRIRSELRKLDKALQDKKDIPSDVTTIVNEFRDKFKILADKIMPKGFGYKVPTKIALRGGYLSTQLLFLGMSVSNFPSAPAEVDLLQIRELNDVVEALTGELNEFIRVEIPMLNKVLKANALDPVKAPKKVEF
jgi:hypothetical protein